MKYIIFLNKSLFFVVLMLQDLAAEQLQSVMSMEADSFGLKLTKTRRKKSRKDQDKPRKRRSREKQIEGKEKQRMTEKKFEKSLWFLQHIHQ